MNLSYSELLPEDFAPQSRVWVYQSSRLFSMSEALEIETLLESFASEWRSHGAEVKAYANMFFGQFIVLMADETEVGVGGCSTDVSVRFIKQLGEQFKVDFFNRTNLAFLIKEKIQTIPMSQVAYAIDNGFLAPDTLYFNNLVQTKQELENNWIIPIHQSWLSSRLQVRTS
jgi:hypothetical protein